MVKASAADFLVEIGTEELPPKALRKLMNAFASGVAQNLDDNRLGHNGVTAYASPRRLAVMVADLALAQEDRETRQKIRRTTLILAAVAISFYLGFILMGVLRS